VVAVADGADGLDGEPQAGADVRELVRVEHPHQQPAAHGHRQRRAADQQPRAAGGQVVGEPLPPHDCMIRAARVTDPRPAGVMPAHPAAMNAWRMTDENGPAAYLAEFAGTQSARRGEPAEPPVAV
jgi:hypothetical protein